MVDTHPSRPQVDWRALLDEALRTPGSLHGVYDRFHEYSLGNMYLFLMQGVREPVASFHRWKSLGRHVVRGARAKEVIVPVLIHEKPAEDDETLDEKRERVARLIGFKVVRAVFALSDTDGPEPPATPLPGWERHRAFDQLGIRQVPFNELRGNVQGYARGTELALNPVAVHPDKTVMHELGHIVLGHTLPHHYEDYTAHRGIQEFQAEAVAYLCMNELGQLDDESAASSRGYIQHWLADEAPPERAIQQVFTAADRILRAGRTGGAEGSPVVLTTT